MHAVRPRILVALPVSVMLLAACGATGGSGAVTPGVPDPAPAPSPSPTATTPVTGRVETPFATIDLPSGAQWVPDGDRVTGSGGRVLRWRYQPVGGGAACVVTLGLITRFTGAFPASALEAFDSAQDPGTVSLRNQVVPAPAGAVAAVRQEQQVLGYLADGSSWIGHLYASQVLTTQGDLVSVAAAAPDSSAPACRPDEAVDSLKIVSSTGTSSPAPGGTP